MCSSVVERLRIFHADFAGNIIIKKPNPIKIKVWRRATVDEIPSLILLLVKLCGHLDRGWLDYFFSTKLMIFFVVVVFNRDVKMKIRPNFNDTSTEP